MDEEHIPYPHARRDFKVAVIVPAYNEERFIGSVLLKARSYADTLLVVDDGSTDATAEVARAAGAIVVRHRRNGGKGVALNTGFRKARELDVDVVVVIDGDGQHLPEEIDSLVGPVVRGEADIVVGSRYLQKTNTTPSHRVVGHTAMTALTNFTSGVRLSDSQSGFRAFSRRAIDAISFSSSGFSVESEMQFLANDKGLKTIEVPITIRYMDKPKRNVLVHGLMVLNGILRIVGQHRPLLFFGGFGASTLVLGLIWGLWVVEIYRANQTLAAGYALLAILLVLLGVLGLFTGVILHSVRGLLLSLVRPAEGRETDRTLVADHLAYDPTTYYVTDPSPVFAAEDDYDGGLTQQTLTPDEVSPLASQS
jgi:glycosyltransferase involved in cell wall biosynthesis